MKIIKMYLILFIIFTIGVNACTKDDFYEIKNNPILISPKNISAIERTPLFEWFADNQTGAIEEFNIILDGSVTGTVDSKTMNYRPTHDLDIGKHSWQIIGLNDFQKSPSELADFTIQGLSKATLTEKPDCVTSNPIIFEWSAVENVDHYVLEIADNVGFSSCQTFDTGNNTSYQTLLSPDGEYFWRVKSFYSIEENEDNFSISDVDSFILETLIPDPPGTVTGFSEVCEGDTNVSYCVDPVADAISYTWTVPDGAQIDGASDAECILVDFPVGSSSGDITVVKNTQCATSNPQNHYVTVKKIPSPPESINGIVNVSPGQSGVIYSIDPVPDATSYNWTVPSGSTITAGDGTTQITVTFGTTSGQIEVTAVNSCGESAPTSLTISFALISCLPDGENPMISVPATDNYSDPNDDNKVSGSNFSLGGTQAGCTSDNGNRYCDTASGNQAFKVALEGFYINQYHIPNCDFQTYFFDLDADGVTSSDSCYFNPNATGPAGITCEDAWNAALADTGRSIVTIDSNGVDISVAVPDTKDELGISAYDDIQGPGGSLQTSPTTQTTYWPGTASPVNEPWSSTTGGTWSFNNKSGSGASPIVWISWYEARAYCKFVYGNNADLPTEAQYERAAKVTTSIANPYPWGTATPNCSNSVYTSCNCSNGSCKVYMNNSGGTIPTNSLGINFNGNVWNWLLDWSEANGTAHEYTTPFWGSGAFGTDWNKGLNPASITRYTTDLHSRAMRGGSWLQASACLSSDYRSWGYPHSRSGYVGFRCVINN